MSVYTLIERPTLESFLQGYPAGELIGFEGISAGIENTNYFVSTSVGEYVLTIFEGLSAQELPYFLDLMAFLSEHGVPSAHPVADRAGNYLTTLAGKPAALVKRLPGHTISSTPSLQQCAALGEAMGRMHKVGMQFEGHRDNDRGPSWWHATAQRVLPHLSVEERELLTNEMAFQKAHQRDHLPRGVIHADLFRDNAMFVDNVLTGIIDFYYACNDVLLYDVAVTVNDWCSNGDGTLDDRRLQAILTSYAAVRKFTSDELAAWPVMLRAGALRFWLSRLQDKIFPREGEITHIKDPAVFRRILQHRVNQAPDLALYA